MVVNTCHRPPADTPTGLCIFAICGEHQVDSVASASYGRRQGGTNTLASDRNTASKKGAKGAVIRGRATTALLHQSCPVAVRDCQVVIGTGGITVLKSNIESSKFYGDDQPLLHLDRLGLLKIVWIVDRMVGRGDHSCAKSF